MRATQETQAAVVTRIGQLILNVRGHPVCFVVDQVEDPKRVLERGAPVEALTALGANLEHARHFSTHGRLVQVLSEVGIVGVRHCSYPYQTPSDAMTTNTAL
jgi:hypothetical protein